jgi:hypothetical protein
MNHESQFEISHVEETSSCDCVCDPSDMPFIGAYKLSTSYGSFWEQLGFDEPAFVEVYFTAAG